MNNKLISLVQAGTHCIEDITGCNEFRVGQIIFELNPLDKSKYQKIAGYYYRNFFSEMSFSKNIPSGLTPIPLDDFFGSEEPVENDHRSPDYADNNKPTPSQPALPAPIPEEHFLLVVKAILIQIGVADKSLKLGKNWLDFYNEKMPAHKAVLADFEMNGTLNSNFVGFSWHKTMEIYNELKSISSGK